MVEWSERSKQTQLGVASALCCLLDFNQHKTIQEELLERYVL